MNDPFFARLIALPLILLSVSFPAVPDSLSNKKAADTLAPVEVIVVTATRSKRRISETPASVSVITKSEIKASPAKTIEDLLSTQTNVQLRRPVAIGEGVPSDISIRGIPGALAASRTLILVDGIPTNASGTPFLIVNEVPMEAIERIEIVRGPNSSLYGANALGGVVNIMTQEGYGKPNGSVVAETSYPFTAANMYGPNNRLLTKVLDSSVKMAYWNINGTVNGGTDKTSFLVSTGYRTIGNYLLRDSALAKKYTAEALVRNINHDYEEFRLLGKAKFYTSDNNSLSLHIRFFKSTLGFGVTKLITPDSLDVETKGQKFLIGPQLKISLSDKVLLRAGAFYRNFIGEFQNEGTDSAYKRVQSYWKSQTNDGQIESQIIITPGPSNVITTGFELLSNNADFGATMNPITKEILPLSYPTNKGIINGAGYIQDELKLLDKRLNMVPVIRMDYHSTFGIVFSPKLGINYKVLEQLRFRTSIGQSFRAPSLAELYMPPLEVNPSFMLRSNRLLKPEYLWGADGGFEALLCKSLTLKIDVFYNKMKDMVSQALIRDSAETYVSHRNISRAWSEGIENELQWRPIPWFWFSANTCFQNSFDETYYQKLDYVPDYTLGLRSGLSWRMKYISTLATVGFRRIGPRSYLDFTVESRPGDQLILNPKSVLLDPYHVIDISFKFTFSRYTLLLTGQNLLNAPGQEAGGTLIPGRFASMKLGISF